MSGAAGAGEGEGEGEGAERGAARLAELSKVSRRSDNFNMVAR